MNIFGDLTLNNDTTVAGELVTNDSIISLCPQNLGDVLDIGFYGKYTSSGSKYAGLIRDASDSGAWKLFNGITTPPVGNVLPTIAAANLGTLKLNTIRMDGAGQSDIYMSYNGSSKGSIDATSSGLNVAATGVLSNSASTMVDISAGTTLTLTSQNNMSLNSSSGNINLNCNGTSSYWTNSNTNGYLGVQIGLVEKLTINKYGVGVGVVPGSALGLSVLNGTNVITLGNGVTSCATFSGGSIGIGGNPDRLFHIKDTANSASLFIQGSSTVMEIVGWNAAYNALSLRAQSGTQLHLATDGKIGIGKTDPSGHLHVHSGNVVSPTTALITNDFSGQNGTASDYTLAQLFMGISSYYAGVQLRIPAGGYADSARLDFTTPSASNNNTQATRMSVTAITGYIGIGTTTPASNLHIKNATSDSVLTFEPMSGIYQGGYCKITATKVGPLGSGSDLCFSTRLDDGANFDASALVYERMRITGKGNVAIGTGAITATNATDGFLYIPGVAGAPTGVPSAIGAGNIYPICFCNATNRLYVYNGGWVSVALT